jgi:serine/threonine protein kinase
MPFDPGTRFVPYEIVELAGAGGMGEVYRGRDTRLPRTVAIKVVAPDERGSAPPRAFSARHEPLQR